MSSFKMIRTLLFYHVPIQSY